MNEEQIHTGNWEQRYVAGNTPWDRGHVSPALIDWLASGRLPPGRILVPGCGYGHEVVELCRHGFSVTAVDVAPSALARLGQRLDALGLVADLVCADWFEWRPEHAFDSIYEQTSLCSLPPSRWRDYTRLLAHWLIPGGRLLALFMQTGKPGGPPWHCDPIAMQRLFPPPAWHWIETSGDSVSHPSGFRELPAVLEHGARIHR